MADEDTIGSAAVQIQVNLDALDKGLTSAKQRLEQFDKTAGGQRNLKSLQIASKEATAALTMMTKQLDLLASKADAAGTDYSAAAGAMAVATRRLAEVDKELFAAERELNVVRRDNTTALSVQTAELNKTVVANDNLARSYLDVSTNTKAANSGLVESTKTTIDSAKSFGHAALEVFKFVGYAKFAIAVLHAGSSTFRNFADKVAGSSAGGSIATGFEKATNAVVKFAPAVKTVVEKAKPIYEVAEGVEAIARHTNVLGAAMYALSPAVRQVTNDEVLRGFHALGLSVQTIGPAVRFAAGEILGRLLPSINLAIRLGGPLLALGTMFKILQLSIALAAERIDASIKLIAKSAETGIGITFIQQLEKASKKVGETSDTIVAMLKRLKDASGDQLDLGIKEAGDKRDTRGAFQKRLQELVDLGNFANNQFLTAVQNAKTAEERAKAYAKFLSEAAAQGEKLAALNLGATFLSEKELMLAAALPDQLQKTFETAEKISKTTIISPENASIALNLEQRMDAAQRILGEKWIPFQENLIRLGFMLKNIWVGILETVAGVLGWISKIEVVTEDWGIKLRRFLFGEEFHKMELAAVAKANDIQRIRSGLAEAMLNPEKIAQAARSAQDVYEAFSQWAEKSNLTKPAQHLMTFNTILKSLAAQAGETGQALKKEFALDELQQQFTAAKKALEEAFVLEGEFASMDVFNEKMKKLVAMFNAAKEALDSSSQAWDREIERINRHIAILTADAASIGKTRSFQEQLRVETQLLNVVAKTGTDVTQEQIDKYIVFRVTMDAVTAATKAGIDVSKEWIKVLDEISKRAGEARMKAEAGQFREAQRERMRAAEFNIRTAEAEIKTIGLSIAEQQRLMGVEQLRQQLEQDAAQRKGRVDQAELERLTKKIEKTAELKQKQAELAAQDNANFDLQTIGLSDVEKSIASIQRQLHGNNWRAFMNDGLSATLRLVDTLNQLKSITMDVTVGIMRDFRNAILQGATAWEAFKQAGLNALNKIADKLLEMAAQQLVLNAFGGSSGGGLAGLLGSFFGGGANPAVAGTIGVTGAAGSMVVPTFPMHRGGRVGDQRPSLAIPASFFVNAPSFAMGLNKRAPGINEVPVLAHRGEMIGWPSQMREMFGGKGDGINISFGGTQITIQGDASKETVKMIRDEVDKLERTMTDKVVNTVRDQRSRGEL